MYANCSRFVFAALHAWMIALRLVGLRAPEMDGGGSTSMAFLVCVAGGICCIYIVRVIHLVATGIERHFK